jgi:hypothetical protein
VKTARKTPHTQAQARLDETLAGFVKNGAEEFIVIALKEGARGFSCNYSYPSFLTVAEVVAILEETRDRIQRAALFSPRHA